MPTFPQLVHRSFGVALLLAAALTTPACGGGGVTTVRPRQALVLEPMPETIWVHPGDHSPVRFRVRTTEGAAVPMVKVSFVILDEPAGGEAGSQSQGATLSGASSMTDAQGVAEIDVTAGQRTVFRIRATIDDLEAEAVIVVAPGQVGSVEVAPFLEAGGAVADEVTGVEILFFDNLLCRDLSFARPPAPARNPRLVAARDGSAQYDFVSTNVGHAIMARGHDGRGGILAAGCVDLPGTALVSGGVVRVALPLGDFSPNATGRYTVTSRFVFERPLAAAATVAVPWLDLQDCPLDPAQLWLDCTMDALSGPVDGDPNDCQPRTPAEEGVLGPALAARRGTFLPQAGGGVSSCRGVSSVGGGVSHDALLMGLFGSPKPKALVDLSSVADDARRILGSVTLRSQLSVREAGGRGVYQADHIFVGASFALPATTFEVGLLPLALPVLEVPAVRATARARRLDMAAHAITLRLGTVARAAFGELALARRGLPAGSRELVASIAALAKAPTTVTTADPAAPASGCVALDAVLCADLGRPVGCLIKACEQGLAAMALSLDLGFSAADGEGLDLMLQGSAPLLDPHATGFVDRLGDALTMPGTWSATFHTRAGIEDVTGVWDAFRTEH